MAIASGALSIMNRANYLERGIHGYFPFGARQRSQRTHAATLAQLEDRVERCAAGAVNTLPAIACAGARALVRPALRRGVAYQRLISSVYQSVRALLRRGGLPAVRILPLIVKRVRQNAKRHGLSVRDLSRALRHITTQVAHSPQLLHRLSSTARTATNTFVDEDWDEASRVRRLRVGPYRHVRGHHIHQAASYGRSGPSQRTNPNYRRAIAIAHGPALTRRQHRRADTVQRNLNRAYRGQTVNQPQIGNVRIQARGTGTLAPTPNPYFEDVKAYYALRAAGIPPDQSLTLVNQSAAQLERSGTQPVRVPTR